MPTPYVYERQVEYWTSRGMETFFLDAGFEIIVFPLTQLTESDVPSDFLYLDTETNKIFGFQFKALYQNGEDHWNLKSKQHTDLATFDWMFYGLSDLKETRQHRNALHYLRVVPTGFPFQSKLPVSAWRNNGIPTYLRWAAFYEGLRSCRYGLKIKTKHELQRALWPKTDTIAPRELSEMVDEVFIANLDRKRAARFSAAIARPIVG